MADAPAGYTVNAVIKIDGSFDPYTGISSPRTLTTGRLTSGGTFIVAQTISGTLQMLDAPRNQVGSPKAIPATNYYGA